VNQYAIYLRKSRKDNEAEQHGEGETLERHKSTLKALAKRRNLNVTKIFEEVVSGDTISSRPEMQKLLQEVESGQWAGVLVIEVERLARGDTKDQGQVAQAFKYSQTLIITPQKTYDPTNEFDEEYFEFGLFMSRREFKTITRRMQRGRITSAKEGKYTASKPPYGYTRVKLTNEKGWTLEPHPTQADIVRLIYEWYTQGIKQENGTHKRIGTTLIARQLNNMRIPPQIGEAWAGVSIRDILINPVYIGKIRWNWRPHKKKMLNGIIKKERPRASESNYLLTQGRHKGIIDQTTYETAQEYISKNPPRPIGEKHKIKNPWAGLIICGKCKKRMTRRPYNKTGYPDTLLCQNITCDNISTQLALVEQRILEALSHWLSGYKLKWPMRGELGPKKNMHLQLKQKTLANLNKDLKNLQSRLDGIYNNFEEGIYSKETFQYRKQKAETQIKEAEKNRINLEADLQLHKHTTHIPATPTVENLQDVYNQLPHAEAKNDLLKEVLEKIEYTKTKKGSKQAPTDNFEIVIYPRLPIGFSKNPE